MRAWVCIWVVCAGVAWAGVARAAPCAAAGDARAKHKAAAQLHGHGDYAEALVCLDEGLAAAPKDLALLGLKGTVLLELRDYAGALAAYQAYLDAGARGANRREAQKIVDSLRAVRSTFLDIALANGPAVIYLDSKAQGVFCNAAPSCTRAVLPGDYKVIAERDGFERWTGRVAVESDRTAKLAVTLVEKPSPLTVRVAPPGARVTVDGADAPATIAAGTHQVVVSLAGYRDARLEATAHQGAPIALEVALAALVPIRIAPASAALVLDGEPAAVEAGRLAVLPGAHVLVARAPGFRERRIAIAAERAADFQLEVALEPAAAAVEPGASISRKTLGITLIEIGGAALGGGLILGLEARSAENNARSGMCDGCDRTPAIVVASVGGAAVVAGAILWLTAPSERAPQALRVVPSVGGDRVGLAVAGRF